MSAKKLPLDNFLHEIDKNFISIKNSSQQFKVFKGVFDQVHEKLKQVDNYYGKYSSKIQYAGSYYDGVKVGQLDEFDMDIIIRLPIDYNEIVMENHVPGFVKLKIGSVFDDLDKQPHWESHHKVTRDWRDSNKYLLQNQFRNWMESVVTKALNELDRKVVVENVTYNLAQKKSGPAITINAKNTKTLEEVDVDLVPVIQFTLPRWPDNYRKKVIEGDSNKNTWLVVPKPNKAIDDVKVQNRCWRLAFHDQERDIIKDCKNLKPTLRFLKKLRDAMGMKGIASYYIKSLFLWKVEEPGHDKKYWENKQSVLFKDMIQKFHDALERETIPYFWNKGYNLIGAINKNVLAKYKEKLKKILGYIENNSIVDIVKCMLTPEEFEKFRDMDVYKTFCVKEATATNQNPPKTVEKPPSTSTQSPQCPTPTVSPGIPLDTTRLLLCLLESNKILEDKLERVLVQVAALQDKVEKLEVQVKNTSSISSMMMPMPTASPLVDLLN